MKHKDKELKAAGLVKVYDPADWFWGNIFFIIAILTVWFLGRVKNFPFWWLLLSVAFLVFLVYLLGKKKAKIRDQKMRQRIIKRQSFIVYDKQRLRSVLRREVTEDGSHTFRVSLGRYLYFCDIKWIGVWEKDNKIRESQRQLMEKERGEDN